MFDCSSTRRVHFEITRQFPPSGLFKFAVIQHTKSAPLNTQLHNRKQCNRKKNEAAGFHLIRKNLTSQLPMFTYFVNAFVQKASEDVILRTFVSVKRENFSRRLLNKICATISVGIATLLGKYFLAVKRIVVITGTDKQKIP